MKEKEKEKKGCKYSAFSHVSARILSRKYNMRCVPKVQSLQFSLTLYSFGLDLLSGFRIASFHIREKVLRICVSREGSQNMFSYLGNMVEVTAIGSKPAA